MANAKSYFYNTRIEADGWGALSTDAAGDDAYLEANDCTIIVRNSGYGAYADFGAEVVINDSRMTVPTYGVIIAGPAETHFNEVIGTSGGNLAMIHSVMGQPSDTGELTVHGGTFESAGPAILVKSANANIELDGATIVSKSGVLAEIRKNEDRHATRVGDYAAPGVKLVLTNGEYNGDILDTDPERPLEVTLKETVLSGGLEDVTLVFGDATSQWKATRNSTVTLSDANTLSRIDAGPGILVEVKGLSEFNSGPRALASGGQLIFQSSSED